MLRAKHDKLSTVKDLLSDTKKQVLTASELRFLKSRNVLVDDNKAPLMIYSYDSKQTEKTIRAIALKLDCPVIKIVKVITVFLPEVITYPEPVKEVINEVPELEVIPDPEVMEPEPELIESEPTIKPGVKYKLSFPNAWTVDMDEDDIDMNIPVKQKSDLRTLRHFEPV